MTTINIAKQDSVQRGWNRPINSRVARAGIVLIVAAVALLGLVSVTAGTNSDAAHPPVTSALAH